MTFLEGSKGLPFIKECYEEGTQVKEKLLQYSQSKKDFSWFDDILNLKELRNSISFVTAGIKESLQCENEALALDGIKRLWGLLNLCLQTRHGLLFLAAVDNAIAFLHGLKAKEPELAFELNCSLAEGFIKLKSTGWQGSNIIPWPSQEAFDILASYSEDKLLAPIRVANKLLNAIPNSNSGIIRICKIFSKMKRFLSSSSASQLQDLISQSTRAKRLIQLYTLCDSGENNQLVSKVINEAEKELNAFAGGEHAYLYMMDIAELSLNRGNFETAERIISKFPFAGSIERNLLRVQIENEKLRKRTEKPSLQDIRHLLSSIQGVITKATESNYDIIFIHKACLLGWKIMNDLDLLCDNFRPVCCDLLRTICETSEKAPGLEKRLIASFEHELAICYETQSIFSLAMVHAAKALKIIGENDEKSKDIELFSTRLWIKGNTFDGNLKPELKALSLADQAKCISEPSLIYKILEKSLKTIVTDHELLVASESYDISSLLQNNFKINFDVIEATSPKSRYLVHAALYDILRQSRAVCTLEEKASKDSANNMFWKMVLDASGYLLSKQWNYKDDDANDLKFQSEALNCRGEALSFFLNLCSKKSEIGQESLFTTHRSICETFLSSFNLGCRMKDAVTINATCQNIWNLYSNISTSNIRNNSLLWLDVFHTIYEGLMESSLTSLSLFVYITTGYARVLKDHHEINYSSQNPEEKAPQQNAKTKNSVPSKPTAAKPLVSTKDSNFANPIKLADEVCTNGLLSNCQDYEAKLNLFDLRSSLKSFSTLANLPDGDPILKVFTMVEVLESNKKPGKEDIETVIIEITKVMNSMSQQLSLRIWLRVIRFAIKVQQFQAAFFCIKSLSLEGMSNAPKAYLCELELLYASSILSLPSSGLFYGNELSIRLDSLRHFVICAKCASSSEELFLNHLVQALESCLEISNSKPFQKDKALLLPPMEELTRTLNESFSTNIKFHDTVTSDPLLQKLIIKVFYFCIDTYSVTSNWHMALQTIERLFRIMPPSLHQTLAKKKLQILSESGKSIAITLLKDAELEDQINIWKLLSEKQVEVNKKKDIYHMLVSALKRAATGKDQKYTPLLISTYVKFSGFLIRCNDNMSEATIVIEEIKAISNGFESGNPAKLWSSFFANVLSADMEPNYQKQSKTYAECYDQLMGLVKIFYESLVQASIEVNGSKQPQATKKTKEASLSDYEIPDVNSPEKWFAFEWPTSVTLYATENCGSSFMSSLLNIPDIRLLISSILRLAIELQERGRYSHCIPILLILELVVVARIEAPSRSPLLALLYILMSNSFFWLAQPERAIKKFIQYSSSSADDELSHWPWQDSSISDSDVGYRLSTSSVLVLLCKCHLFRLDFKRARIALMKAYSIPNESKNSDKEALTSILLYILTQTQNLKQVPDAILENDMISTTTDLAFTCLVWLSFSSHKQHLSTIFEALEKKRGEGGSLRSEPKLLLLQYEILLKLQPDLVEIRKLNELLNQYAVYMSTFGRTEEAVRALIRHATIMRHKKDFNSSTEKMRWAIDILDTLDSAKKHLETSLDVKIFAPLKREITLEYCETMLQAFVIWRNPKENDNSTSSISKIREFFQSDDTNLTLSRWQTLKLQAHDCIVSTLQQCYQVLSGMQLARALRMLGITLKSNQTNDLHTADAKIIENYFQGAIKISIDSQDYSILDSCCEELLHSQSKNGALSIFTLALYQGCQSFQYLTTLHKRQSGIREELFGKDLSSFAFPIILRRNSLFANTSNSWQRCQLFTITPEMLQDLPKGFRVIIMRLASDLKSIFIGVINKNPDAGKNRAGHAEEVEISTALHPIDFDSLSQLKQDLSIGLETELSETYRLALKNFEDFFGPLLIPVVEAEPESTKHVNEKTEKKKGAAKEEAPGEKHCLICSDEILEAFPFELLFRNCNFATVSRDFGLHYILSRFKENAIRKKQEKDASTEFSLFSFDSYEHFKISKGQDGHAVMPERYIFGKENAALKLLQS
ncbi:hypothetical protein HDU97_001052 [Phlyctochytrium planicorne]|nr:hypothetical protein HDU97_001052 [Phlyctochytrium planicorne]